MKTPAPLPFTLKLVASKASQRRAHHAQIIIHPGISSDVRRRLMGLANTFQPRTTWDPEGFVLTRDRAEKFWLLFAAGFRDNSTRCGHYYSPPGCDVRFHLSVAIKLARDLQEKLSGAVVVPFADSPRQAIA